jgi:hypothetical protein
MGKVHLNKAQDEFSMKSSSQFSFNIKVTHIQEREKNIRNYMYNFLLYSSQLPDSLLFVSLFFSIPRLGIFSQQFSIPSFKRSVFPKRIRKRECSRCDPKRVRIFLFWRSRCLHFTRCSLFADNRMKTKENSRC